MPGTPEISVCVLVYNVEPYLQQCVDSLMNQTVSVETEYIFVNDCSTDNSGKILRRNQAAHPDKIRVLEHTENRGPGEVRNTLLQAARGRYIAFVDSDDFVAPRMYETLYRTAVETDADVCYIQFAYIAEDEIYDWKKVTGGGYEPAYPWNERLLRWDNRELTDEGRVDLRLYPTGDGCWCGLWKRSVWDENNLTAFPIPRYEDNYFFSLATCYLTKVAFVPEVMYFYRINPNSIIRSKNCRYRDRMENERNLLAEAKRRNLFERYYSMWEYIYIIRYAFTTCRSFYTHMIIPPWTLCGKSARICALLFRNGAKTSTISLW